MRHVATVLRDPQLRPFALLAAVIAVLAVMARGTGYFFSLGTAFSVMQLFATLGLVALGLGLSMLVREFDLSVTSMLSMSGAIAVLTGVQHPWLGVLCGVGAGLVGGTLQGIIMTRLRLSSVGVTLGGLLTFGGVAYVITGNQSISYNNIHISLALNAPILGLLSVRSAVALGIFALATLVMMYTRLGRDIVATGSDRRASVIAGLNTDRVVIGVFAVSGVCSAIAGVLLSYSLGAASPVALSDVLAPAAAAAIIGGISLVGGRGGPLGIAAGAIILCVLRSGLSAIGVSPHVHDIITGAILLVISVIDGPDFLRRLLTWRTDWNERSLGSRS